MARSFEKVRSWSRALVAAVGRALVALFGRVAWQPPAWTARVGRAARSAGAWVRGHRGPSAAAAGALLILIAGGTMLTRWYLHRPKPLTIKVSVTAPAVTRIEDKPRPNPLVLDFEASVAPLAQIGKVVTKGLELAPKVEGTWRWRSDRELAFVPRSDWPIGQAFTIKLAKKGLVAPHIRLESYKLDFKTAPFEVRLSEAQFHQDPLDPALKKIVASFSFSHPVDPASFEKNVRLRFVPSDREDAERDYTFQVIYDKHRGTAHVHSSPIAVPQRDASVVVTVKPGTRAARRSEPFTGELSTNVIVPGLFSLLKVTRAAVVVAENDRSEPEQVLALETSVGVTSAELDKAVKATLLPERTATGEPADWSDPARIGPGDLGRGSALKLTAIPTEKEYATDHTYRLQAPVGRRVYVQVARGVRGFGGYVLGETFQTILSVPAYPRRLKILGSGALLAASGDRKLSVFSRDVPAIRFEIAQVLPDQLHHLVTQSDGRITDPQFGYRFDRDNVTRVFSDVRVIAQAAPGKPNYEALDLGKYLDGGGERRGLFIVRVESYDPASKQPLGESASRLILISDLGVIAKANLGGTQDVFVQSTETGQPLAGARVQLVGKNGLAVFTETTDATGHVRFPTVAGLERERTPALFVVTHGSDSTFLPFARSDRMLDTSRFDVGGVSEEPNAGAAKGLLAYVFSDRGIYRPGDELRIGLIVKNRDWTPAPERLPLAVEILDARGLPVKKETVRLGAAGLEEVRHTTPEVAPTGTYTVNVHVVKDGHPNGLLGSTTVQVREFIPDRMKIRVSLSAENPDGWVAPAGLKGRVSLANLFGTPAARRRVRGAVRLVPWLPTFARHKEFRFFDPLKPREGATDQLADAETDDEGNVEWNLGLERFAPAMYRLTLTADGFEAQGGRSVTAEASAIVSPLPFLVGYKPDGDLGYISRGSERRVELIAIDPQARRVDAKGLRSVLVERRVVSALARQDNGTYRYQSVRREVDVATHALEIPAAGKRLKLPTDRPGEFVWVVRDAQDRDLQRIDFQVTGFGNVSRDVEKNAELQLSLARGDATPGQDLEVQIKAPYAGAGLITIERDHVYSWRWFQAKTTTTVEKITVPADLEGNGYVSVAMLRDPGSDELFMSPLSYGVAPFSISRDRRKVDVSIDTPELSKPGEALRMRYKTDRPAKIVIFAVDEGILRVASYQTPDPLAAFFQKRALSVRTGQTLDMLLPEYRRLVGVLAPGGDDEGALGANLNPFRRKQDKPVAFWSGVLDAGPKAKELTTIVPESFNGTLRVMAVAVAEDAVGSVEKRAVVRGDFVISPNLPLFVAPGDEVEISVAVANNVVGSGPKANVTLAVELPPALQPLDGADRKLSIGELREGVAKLKLRVREPLGAAKLTFVASLGAARARLTTDVSVRPAAPYLSVFSGGRLRGKEATVALQRKLHREFRSVTAAISPLPVGLSHGLAGYLEKVPYGCTEQIVSQVAPSVALGRHPEMGLRAGDAKEAIARWVDTLRARQNEDGSFGQWAANPKIDPLASVWATHMLLEAGEHGFAVPADMVKSATAYLQSLAAADADDPASERLRAYAIYVLTRTGMVTTTWAAAHQKHLEANHPKVWKQGLPAVFLAATYKLLKQERQARALVDALKWGQDREPDYASYYDRLAHDAQVLYLVARHFPEQAAKLGGAEIEAVAKPVFGGHYNTFSSAWAILALEAYGHAATQAAQAQAPITAAEQVGGQLRALQLTRSLIPQAPVSEQATGVRFTNPGPFDAYYVVSERGFDRGVPGPLQQKIEVFREYTDKDGKAVKAVKLGDQVTVVLRVRALGKQAVPSVALVDLLPGGFEAVIQPKAGPGEDADPEEGEDGESPDEPGDVGDEGGEGEAEGDGEGEEAAQAPTEPGGDEGYALPIALPGSTFALDYGDVREDRVVLYGTAGSDVTEYRYAVKATTAGTFVVPPPQVEGLYDRTVVARGAGGTITVTAP